MQLHLVRYKHCNGIHGSCAEFIAIGAAITAGEREFEAVVAVHEHAKNGLLAPCGNCRQMLLSYCPEVQAILNDENGEPVKVSIRELLPLAYAPVHCE